MSRRLFNLAAVVSAMLAGLLVALWVRSYRVADTVRWSGPSGQVREVALLPGELRIAVAPSCGARFEHLTEADSNRDVIWSRRVHVNPRWGIGVEQYTEYILQNIAGARPVDRDVEIQFPLRVSVLAVRFTLLVPIFLLLPLASLVRGIGRRVQRDGGRCPSCGYDLRATPERCPECGEQIVKG